MRIVTYNTRGSLGMDGRRSTRRIVEAVRPLAADILCFQEIHRRLPWSGREDQPAVLGHLLGRTFCFQSNVAFGMGGYGIGIAVRGAVAERRAHPLPSKREQRGALEVRLRQFAGFHTLTIFCTHWGLDPEERLGQAESMAPLIRAAPHPVVVCGDFNERAEDRGVAHLLRETGLVDADSAQNRATFVSDNPMDRIDIILYSPDLHLDYFEIVNSQASDHLPVMADFSRVYK
jgi:endonuclease/exonuclease/phosphatase family metal-dependent hydrolase